MNRVPNLPPGPVRLRVVQGCYIDGMPAEAGLILPVDVRTAVRVLVPHVVELVSAEDHALIRAEVHRQATQRFPAGPENTGPRWLRVA